ncbi:MAG: fibronectin type III domain-containing protein [Actinomycetota bacterium]|nr:fibronectin type III domain-containing protein [Actinomycetota bacterium]
MPERVRRVASLQTIACAIAIAVMTAAGAEARDTTPPKPPSRLTASVADGRVVLKWTAASDNVRLHRYRLYKRAAGRRWPRKPFSSRRASVQRRASVSVRPGVRYFFRVKAVDRAGNVSRASKRVSAKLPPATVTSAAPSCEPVDRYGAGRWPGPCWRPFAATSPFNRALPDNPPLAPNSAAVIRRLLSWGDAQDLLAGHADTEHDYYHPVYYSSPGDPVYTVRCVEWTSSCAVEGDRVRIPSAARAAGGGDGHLAVIDQETGWEHDFWQVRSKPGGGGTLVVSHGGKTRIDGDGRGSNATAAWFALSAGIIRGAEMQAGRIEHALFSAIKCTAGNSVAPAEPGTSAAACSTFGLSNTNAPPLGARIQLDMSDAEIDALAVPAWKKTILRALAEYGLIVGDTNGGNAAWGIQGESGSSYTSFGRTDPWRSFAESVDAPRYDGGYALDIAAGVDWTRLRVIAPCVSEGSC